MIVLLILGVVTLAFTAFLALVYAWLTLLLGKVSVDFEVTASGDWTFFDFYKKYLIVAAAFTFVALPLGSSGGLLGALAGFIAMVVAYQFVFDAGWPQALVIGMPGAAIAGVLFIILMAAVLGPLGLLGTL